MGDPCKAGLLLHSIYRTEASNRAVLSSVQRLRLVALLGEPAERLVSIFGSLERASVYAGVPRGEPYRVRTRARPDPVDLSSSEMKDLVWLLWANELLTRPPTCHLRPTNGAAELAPTPGREHSLPSGDCSSGAGGPLRLVQESVDADGGAPVAGGRHRLMPRPCSRLSRSGRFGPGRQVDDGRVAPVNHVENQLHRMIDLRPLADPHAAHLVFVPPAL